MSAEEKQQAEEAKAQAVAKVAELQLQRDAANADLQLRTDAAASARDAAAAAETARVAAADAARQLASELQPVSVLISRKTQRLYVRQAFKRVLDSPVTIADPIAPSARMSSPPPSAPTTTPNCAGTWCHCAAIAARRLRCRRTRRAPRPRLTASPFRRTCSGMHRRHRAALILIVTDEPPSSETGNGTEFVVLLSGEPQGGIRSGGQLSHPRTYWHSPFGNPFGW